MRNNLFNLFKLSTTSHGSRVALVIDNVEYTYNELFQRSSQVSCTLNKYKQERVGIFASRSLAPYIGVLGTLASGKTYVPLNPKFPANRNQTIIDLAGLEIFVVDYAGLEQVVTIRKNLTSGTILIFPTMNKTEIPGFLNEKFRIFSAQDLQNSSDNSADVKPRNFAYIMFTSGSTGVPKGVPVSHDNVFSYINYLRERYELGPEDRFSQTFDLTFDLSVHDLFLSWSVGASLYVIPEKKLMAPAKFIKENKLTAWFSVPSLAQFMKRFKMLKENSFPDLRYSLFCGEPLPKSIATAWQVAAPNSVLENIYGPTEATIGITHYRIPKEEDEILEHNGVVAIGNVFDTQDYCLIDEKNQKVNGTGELCLAGSQLTSGYWNNSEKTADSYFKFPNDDKLWYKTGDIVKKEDNNLLYISRKDFQVKIRGYRIELEEINLSIREITHCDLIRTVPYPVIEGVADNLYSFVSVDCKVDKTEIFKYLRYNLPDYMLPKEIFFIDEFPLNVNGKIDLKQLAKKIPNGKQS